MNVGISCQGIKQSNVKEEELNRNAEDLCSYEEYEESKQNQNMGYYKLSCLSAPDMMQFCQAFV